MEHLASGPETPLPHPALSSKPQFHLIRYMRREDVPMDAARRILRDHAQMMHGRMLQMGGPDFSIDDHINAFWAKLEQVLPPHGAYYLATDLSGAVVGTGALRSVQPGLGEMKHLYVAPQMRRSGLGRALVMARIADAREMGMTTLIADTFSINHEMRALYADIGFVEVPPFAESATVGIHAELTPFMTFLRMEL